MKTPQKGYYYHYKHDPEKDITHYAYKFVAVGHHTEIESMTESALAIYAPLYKNARVYKAGKHFDVRPLGMFMEKVNKNGTVIPRFKLIKDEKIIRKLKQTEKLLYGKIL